MEPTIYCSHSQKPARHRTLLSTNWNDSATSQTNF